MTLQTMVQPAEVTESPSTEDEYWAAYERDVMPRELLALCAVGVSIGTGIVAAVAAFL